MAFEKEGMKEGRRRLLCMFRVYDDTLLLFLPRVQYCPYVKMLVEAKAAKLKTETSKFKQNLLNCSST